MKNWKYNLFTAAAAALILGAFSFGWEYLLPSSRKAEISDWRNAQGGLLVSTIYFLGIFSILTLIRFFRKLS